MARGGLGSVEGHADVGGLLLLENGEERIGEAVKGRGVDALGIADGVLDQREVGPVDQGHAIEEEESWGVRHRGSNFSDRLGGWAGSYRQFLGDVQRGQFAHGLAVLIVAGVVHAIEFLGQSDHMLARGEFLTAHDAK